MKPYRGPPMTLGSAAAARVRLIVWCKDCGHRVEPDAAEMAEGMVLIPRFPTGASGSSAPGAAADDRDRAAVALTAPP